MDIELNDAELVRQIGTGSDREAEGELFRRMASRIRLYGLRHLRNENAAEDLMQQVLIRTGFPSGPNSIQTLAAIACIRSDG